MGPKRPRVGPGPDRQSGDSETLAISISRATVRRVLSGSDAAKLWDAATGQLLRTLEEEGSGVRAVAFSPDGAHVLSAGRLIKLWDVATGELQLIPMPASSADAVAFSPDGIRLLGGGGGGPSRDDLTINTLKLWDVATGRLLRVFGGPADVLSVAFSPDGARVVS